MSRGFVKEDDLEHAGTDLPERPISPYPNYVTPNGLLALQQQAEALEETRLSLVSQKEDPVANQQLSGIERDLRYIQARLETVILVEPAQHAQAASSTVLFGATVHVEDKEGTSHVFHIVGEDEANIAAQKVSYVSPIAKALIGKKIGDTVIWQRPAGNIALEITNIAY